MNVNAFLLGLWGAELFIVLTTGFYLPKFLILCGISIIALLVDRYGRN